MWFVYIVECCDGTLYTGVTTDIAWRLAAHNTGNGAKYTKSRRPVKLVYRERVKNQSEACKRECQIKKFSRAKKLKFIGDWREGINQRAPKK